MKQITIIGNGNMALAIAKGLNQHGYKLEVLGRNLDKLNQFEDEVGNTIKKVPNYLEDRFDISNKEIILAFKPNNLTTSSKAIFGEAKRVFSILAGTTLKEIKTNISSKSYIRAMPNLSASFQKSITSLTGDIDSQERSKEIFAKIGKTVWFESENELDIATAIAGSGPAYLSLIAEALADGGVKAGLKREDAKKLVFGLFDGFSSLIEHEDPSLIKNRVMSPKGTTAYGYATLEEYGVRGALINAVTNSYQRAIDLGKK